MFIRFSMLIFLTLILLQPLKAQQEESNRYRYQRQQQEQNDTLSDRLYFGGYLWARFSNFETRLEVAPQMGYHVTKRLDAGVGGKYMYYYYNSELPGTGRYSSHIFGGSVFTSYTLIKNMNEILPIKLNGRLLTHLEYEALSMPNQVDFRHERSGSRFWSHNYFIGGGLRQQIGKRAFISFLILYNLNEKSYSPYYNNPMIRISFGF